MKRSYAQQPQKKAVESGRWATSFRHVAVWWAKLPYLVSRNPVLVLVPLLLLLVLVASGAAIVRVLVNLRAKAIRSGLQGAAELTASSLDRDVRYSFLPCFSLANMIQYEPRLEPVSRAFQIMSVSLAELKRRENAGGDFVFDTYSLAYRGVVTDIWPLEGNEAAVGLDLLRASHARNDTFDSITARDITIGGPVTLVQGGVAILARFPVFVEPFSAAHNFNGTDAPPEHEMPRCHDDNGLEFCYDPDSQSRFWGISGSLYPFEALLDNSPLRHLVTKYAYRLTRPSDVPGEPPELLKESHALRPMRDPVRVEVPLFNQLWILDMELLDPHTYNFAIYWYVAVAIASAGTAAALFMLMVSHQQHTILLRKLLPKSIIEQLHQGRQVGDRFENVTALFCCIVWPDDDDLQTMDIMECINHLYSEFDDLTDKHELYKLDSIGDVFLLVGGCPEKEDPVKAAAKVVRCAVDMLTAAKRFTAPNGKPLQVRVGVHSGPAMTGVLGTKLPKFTLYGDTINIASRMQSTADPGCIRLSHASTKLLLEAADAPVIGRREVVDVKGRGTMLTYLLAAGEDLPPNTPEELRVIASDCALAALRAGAELSTVVSRTTTRDAELSSSSLLNSSITLDE